MSLLLAAMIAADLPRLATPTTCRAEQGHAAAFGGRRTFALRPDQLAAIKASSDPAVKAALAEMTKRADAALTRRTFAVTTKTVRPPSGDLHDYLSIAPYWWPDPADPKKPYIRRDGETNPERDTARFDRTAMTALGRDTEALGLAYFYTGDTRYAAKAAAVIRTWFLDPATRMNPNANFAQAVIGREDGRAEGVLDTSAFLTVVEMVGLLAPSGALPPTETTALEAWFSAYVDWMLTSRNGRGEGAAKNNHAMWYDAQLTRYALFARRPDVARKVIEAFPKRRLATQIADDGRLPAELARTRSLHYTVFALQPAYDVADMAACLGYDLWNAEADGRSLRRATDFVAAYRGRIADWPYKEIRPEPGDLDNLLARAALTWRTPKPAPLRYPAALQIAPD